MKLRTTLPLITIVIFSLLVAGCGKSGGKEPGDYFIKYKANGAWFTWKDVFGDLGPSLITNGVTTFGLESFDDDEMDAFDIFLNVTGSIGTGTYTFPADNITVDYRLNAYGPSETIYGINQVTGRPAPQFTLTFTSITDDEIRGTFTANYLGRSGTDETIELTEGEFVIPRIR
jgi:hypothetical protein